MRAKPQSAEPPEDSVIRIGVSRATAKARTALGWSTSAPEPVAVIEALGTGGGELAPPPHPANARSTTVVRTLRMDDLLFLGEWSDGSPPLRRLRGDLG